MAVEGRISGELSYGSGFVQDVFGLGSDGDLSISSGTTTLTRSMFYRDVTITGTASLIVNMWLLSVSGVLDISGAPENGIVAYSYANINGGNASVATAGTAVAQITTAGGQPLLINFAGTNGTSGSNTNATQASLPTAQSMTCVLSNGGAAGGKGGDGASGTGGASRALQAAGSYFQVTDFTRNMVYGSNTSLLKIGGGGGGPGGSGGGGDGTAGGGGGGGGGGGLGLWIAAKTIHRGAGTAAKALSANGGNGGNGGVPAGGNRGGGGGGAGGGGGWIYIIYESLTGTQASNCVAACGGNGGNGGNGTGTGTPGNGGSGGVGGVIILQPTNGTASITTGTTHVAASGQTGGTGEQVVVSL